MQTDCNLQDKIYYLIIDTGSNLGPSSLAHWVIGTKYDIRFGFC